MDLWELKIHTVISKCLQTLDMMRKTSRSTRWAAGVPYHPDGRHLSACEAYRQPDYRFRVSEDGSVLSKEGFHQRKPSRAASMLITAASI
ncbi:hypothetical protein ACLK17_05590 [Escherichia coli]